ncbi:MAG: hypothetical protein WCC87_11790 [Candidatus Korobacteraceae bacterium]
MPLRKLLVEFEIVIRSRSFFYVGAEQDYVNIPYWTQFEPQAPGTVVPSYLSSLQRQVVGNSDPTSVFARADFLLNQANTLNLQFNFNRVNANDIDIDGSTRSIAPTDQGERPRGWPRAYACTQMRRALYGQMKRMHS